MQRARADAHLNNEKDTDRPARRPCNACPLLALKLPPAPFVVKVRCQ